MARRIVWSLTAISDVQAIGDYIERDSLRYAKVVVRKLHQSVERLADFPQASGIVPELNREDVRQINAYSYRIIVRVSDDQIEVVTVIHGARDVAARLSELI